MSVNIQTSDGLVKIAGTPKIDTSFSNISKNPVQNNVITQKFEQIDSQIRTQNSNLDTLEFGEVAGGKNLLYLPNPYSITGTYGKYITVKVKKNTNYTLSVGSVTSSVYQGIVVKP